MTFIKILHIFYLGSVLTVVLQMIRDRRVVYLCRIIFFFMSNDLTAKEIPTEKLYIFKTDTSGMILL